MDPTETKPDTEPAPNSEGSGHGHWLMIACCIPIAAIAVFLVVSGAPLATLALGVACMAMMGFMMLAMMRS
jgi:hypothetical protein